MALLAGSQLPAVAEASIENPSLADSSRVYDLDAVYVVAQPKEQLLLRRQSLSSSMFSGSEMASFHIDDLRSLSAYSPNFIMPDYGSRYTSSLYSRGIGSRINAPAVGIYVDGIPVMSKSAFNSHFYDVERVDVLRGPQGTLYGMNSEGGLVRVYTRNPLRYQGTDIKAGVGSHGYQNYQVSNYSRLGHNLGLMAGGFFNGQNGFFRNATLGTRADKIKEAGGRLKFVWSPSERWNISLLGDYQYTWQNGFPYGQLDLQSGRTASPASNHQGFYRRNVVNTGLNVGFRGNWFDFYSVSSYQYLKDYMRMDIDYMPADYMYMEERQFQNAFTQELSLKSNRPGFWHWTLGGFFSAQWLKTNAPVHMQDEMDKFLGGNIQSAMYNAMVNAMAQQMMQRGLTQEQAMAAAQAAIAKAGGVEVSSDLQTIPGLFRTPVYNLGFYHESSFDITPRLTATLGLRYDYSHVSIDYVTSARMLTQVSVMGRAATQNLSVALADKRHNDYNQLLPKFSLNYRFDRAGSNVYATVSKGYRAGGYNIQMFSDILSTMLQQNSAQRGDYKIPVGIAQLDDIANTVSYKPETSWNYEAGLHLNLFDNSVHFDLAAFYMQVRNQQISQMAGNYGFGRMMTNVGKSYSCGFEATLRGNAFDNHFSYMLSYGLTHAAFKEYSDNVRVGRNLTRVDYKDNRIPFIPQHTLAASADYRFDFGGRCLRSLTLGANFNGQGKTYWDEANTISQKFYGVLGAHLAADFGWLGVNVWGHNLTQTRYNTFAVESAATGQSHWFAQRGNPFQMGVDVSLHF
ncbi:MAG: TonB-dependent receptor [Prevotella sp.]|nr:TonB-dependent receptor [Bacteroidales bacterium]MDY4956865.1 TonB-dependent receptor [Prevotella sp.]